MKELIDLEEIGKIPADCKVIANKNYGSIDFGHIGWFMSDDGPFLVIEHENEIEIDQKKTWNAAFRDWLLERTRRIPKSLSGFKICLLGTKYQRDGRNFFEYLYKEGDAWLTGIHYLDQELTPDFIIPYFENN